MHLHGPHSYELDEIEMTRFPPCNSLAVGLSVTRPHMEAGMRRLPAKSLPIANGVPPAARRQASPPEEPPGVLNILQRNSNFEIRIEREEVLYKPLRLAERAVDIRPGFSKPDSKRRYTALLKNVALRTIEKCRN